MLGLTECQFFQFHQIEDLRVPFVELDPALRLEVGHQSADVLYGEFQIITDFFARQASILCCNECRFIESRETRLFRRLSDFILI